MLVIVSGRGWRRYDGDVGEARGGLSERVVVDEQVAVDLDGCLLCEYDDVEFDFFLLDLRDEEVDDDVISLASGGG
jgi:hypothetical protein